MELEQDLDYMLDVIAELGGWKEYLGWDIPHGCVTDRLGCTEEFGIEIMTWSGDKGWLTDPEEPDYTHNSFHINILIPGTKTPTSASIIAKLDITKQYPPQTEEEVKSLLFKVNEDLFLPEYCGMILKWANSTRCIFDTNPTNWGVARSNHRGMEALTKPRTKELRKRCGLE